MLRAIIPCYCPFLFTVSEISSHYRCRYLLSDILHDISPFPILQTTQIKLEPKDFIFLVKSLYIQFTPQLFSTVYIPNKVRKTSAPYSHTCKPSPDEIISQQPKKEEVFHLVAIIEVT